MCLNHHQVNFLLVSTLSAHQQSGGHLPPLACINLAKEFLGLDTSEAVNHCLHLEATCRAIDKGHLLRRVESGKFILENGDGRKQVNGQFLEACSPEWAEKIKTAIKNWAE